MPWNFYPLSLQNRGLLGSRPATQQPEANVAQAIQLQPTQDFATAFNMITLTDPPYGSWCMDSGATTHLASSSGMLHSVDSVCTGNSITVGNGSSIPVIKSGSSSLLTPTRSLHLHNILVAPHVIKNLIYVRRFTHENFCSIEFDPFGFSVKDLITKTTLLRSNSDGELYHMLPFQNKRLTSPAAFISVSPDQWHHRLGHTNNETLKSLIFSQYFQCNKGSLLSSCKACQIGKHIKLPFHKSNTTSFHPFQLVRSEIWTSPVSRMSGINYYILFLMITHTLCGSIHFDAKAKYLPNFFTSLLILKVNSNPQSRCFNVNGGEFANTQLQRHFDENGIFFRFSCPYISSQNGKSELMIRTVNNTICYLLFHSELPPTFWVEALIVFVHLQNILPSSSIRSQTLFLPSIQQMPYI